MQFLNSYERLSGGAYMQEDAPLYLLHHPSVTRQCSICYQACTHNVVHFPNNIYVYTQ